MENLPDTETINATSYIKVEPETKSLAFKMENLPYPLNIKSTAFFETELRTPSGKTVKNADGKIKINHLYPANCTFDSDKADYPELTVKWNDNKEFIPENRGGTKVGYTIDFSVSYMPYIKEIFENKGEKSFEEVAMLLMEQGVPLEREISGEITGGERKVFKIKDWRKPSFTEIK